MSDAICDSVRVRRYMSGEFNALTSVPSKQWDMMEAMIRKTKGS